MRWPLMTQFAITLREIGTYKEVIRSQKRLTQLQSRFTSLIELKVILKMRTFQTISGDTMVTGFFVESTINRRKLRMAIDFVDDEWIEAYSGFAILVEKFSFLKESAHSTSKAFSCLLLLNGFKRLVSFCQNQTLLDLCNFIAPTHPS
ncbi:hypothetical protein COLO4_33297 [Corchorus olitorius]|uniref:Uncharacterized protein n=1 Tax=Corchorus olitorius TaxID=93759 RepID=A0A1R3GV15_9ROSI|nr:hypothetical protein COLO4_33297 [Corchorus olitorius]